MKVTHEIHKVDGADHCNVFVLVGDQLTLVEGVTPEMGSRLWLPSPNWASTTMTSSTSSSRMTIRII